ncbi:hypothetical protein ACWGF2_19775 [Streptomyces sp. NPDC054919]
MARDRATLDASTDPRDQRGADVLRRELVDARFLGHLTTLLTHALRGVASVNPFDVWRSSI